MPVRDLYHDCVRTALEKDGWAVTHDPFPVWFGGRSLQVDLAGERLLSASRGEEYIAVEVKTFGGGSDVYDMQAAIGQFMMYRAALRPLEPRRTLFLAVSRATDERIFREDFGQAVLAELHIPLLIFDPDEEVIVEWKP